ncbi:hypothetical protein CJ030_MR1G022257 [Morella rubra]|uniref:Uncharacterized protein n=1 Tax=Morella rubra TaxID=262757 RepID=A0A6A1WNP3_9ROSI|nr:hypothetical protein CJ030_MR1G022257 [Morella rubra]
MCVSKGWNALISSAPFLRAHSQRSLGTLSGLFFQQSHYLEDTDEIDNDVSEWVLKHRLTKLELWGNLLGKLDSSGIRRLTREQCAMVTVDEKATECDFQQPLAFYEHVLYVDVGLWLYSFDFRTWTLKSHCPMDGLRYYWMNCTPTVLPFCSCLTPTKFLHPTDWTKSMEDLGESSSQGRVKRKKET